MTIIIAREGRRRERDGRWKEREMGGRRGKERERWEVGERERWEVGEGRRERDGR